MAECLRLRSKVCWINVFRTVSFFSMQNFIILRQGEMVNRWFFRLSRKYGSYILGVFFFPTNSQKLLTWGLAPWICELPEEVRSPLTCDYKRALRTIPHYTIFLNSIYLTKNYSRPIYGQSEHSHVPYTHPLIDLGGGEKTWIFYKLTLSIA